MRVLSVKNARSIWLIRIQDLNPSGKYILPLIFSIAEKYGFIDYTKPNEIDTASQKPISFTRGSFLAQSGERKEVGVHIWRDGFVAETMSSTNDSDFFLDGFLDWLATDFGMVNFRELVMSRLYASELFVSTDKNLALLNPKLEGFVSRINSMVKAITDKNLVFELGAVGIWNDRSLAPNNFFSPFRFERAEEAPFSENRYYSAAPVRTSDHIVLLEEFEQILTG